MIILTRDFRIQLLCCRLKNKIIGRLSMDSKILGLLLLMASPLVAAPQVALIGFLPPETIANFLLLWFGLGFLALAIITSVLIARGRECETEESG